MKAVRTIAGYRVELDLEKQVVRLEVPDDRDYGRRRGSEEAPLSPTIPGLGASTFVAAAILAEKAKQLDDGLYAAVELAAERGAGKLRGKAALLGDLAVAIADEAARPGSELPVIFAAASLGGIDVQAPEAADDAIARTIRDFLADELRSKPISFYTWSADLARTFRQDRLLQTELRDPASIEALARALGGTHAREGGGGGAAAGDAASVRLLDTYDAYLALVARLTNPFPPEKADLRAALDALERNAPVPSRVSVLPPSRAHETELVKKLFGAKPIPEGVSLVDELVKRIRAGEVDLAPKEDSGWYDHQTWALEPLVIPEKMPEARKLELDESYRKVLEELFRSILARTRETHVKQLEVPAAGCGPPMRKIAVAPEITVEPLATHFRRRALSYAFIRRVLEDAFGDGALAGLHRLTAEGPVEATLADELWRMEQLFQGASANVCRELGLAPEARSPGAEEAFAAFRKGLATDRDLGRDGRMMVPLFHDVGRKRTKVLAFLGWTTRPLSISFARPPGVEVFDARSGKKLGPQEIQVDFERVTERLAYPVTVEVYVERMLDRAELRKLCDERRTQSAIVRALEERP